VAIPKKLIICGKTYSVIKSPKNGGGSFSCGSQKILVGTKWTKEVQHDVLIHEVLETILAEKSLRFSREVEEKTNGDYLFTFDHDRFDEICSELSYILRQIYGHL